MQNIQDNQVLASLCAILGLPSKGTRLAGLKTFTVKMEAAGTSIILVPIYQTTWCHQKTVI
jgi:hypothetical protein